ncbi:hypothetical protein BGX28_006200 [Mortierella sp. GBA30]|nr:hypothetical protein BGX28_006200 [Mortierella sp. GBA30]
MEKPSKRTSLFLELQNFQTKEQQEQEQQEEEDLDESSSTAAEYSIEQDVECCCYTDNESLMKDDEDHGVEMMSQLLPVSPTWHAKGDLLITESEAEVSSRFTELASDSESADGEDDDITTFHSGLFVAGPRRCSSFPSGRRLFDDHHQQQQGQQIQIQQQEHHGEELHQVIQKVDSELDRAAETIDGLTRDLMMVVASHQSWLQMKLEKEIQSHHMLQGDGVMEDEFVTNLDRYYDSKGDDGLSNMEYPVTQEQNKFRATLGSQALFCSGTKEDVLAPSSRSLLSSENLSKYLQALKTITDIKHELGFENLDLEQDQERKQEEPDYNTDDSLMIAPSNGYTGGNEPMEHDTDINHRRFSGSSYTLTNGSSRNSASSTLSLETRFDSYSTLTGNVNDLDPLKRKSLTPFAEYDGGVMSARSLLKLFQQPNDRNIDNETDLVPQDRHDNANVDENVRTMQALTTTATWPVLQQPMREEDLETILKLHHDLVLKASRLGSKWMAINMHLPLFIFWSFVFGIGTVFMQSSVTKHAGTRLAKPLQSISSALQLQSWGSPAEQLLEDTHTPDSL